MSSANEITLQIEFRSVGPAAPRLHVQALRDTLVLLIEDLFPGFLEICMVDAHTPLTQRQQARLCADGLDVCA